MTKLYMIACCGMLSVFNAAFVVQKLFASDATPVFSSASDWTSAETGITIIREFGFPVFMSLVFALACAIISRQMYRDNRNLLKEKDAMIAARDVVIANMRKQLDEAHEREKMLIGQIARLEGQRPPEGGSHGTN